MRTRFVHIVLLIAVIALNAAVVCKAVCPPSHSSHHMSKEKERLERQGITVCTVSDSRGYSSPSEAGGETIRCACADDLSYALSLDTAIGVNLQPAPSNRFNWSLPSFSDRQAWSAPGPVESPPKVFQSA